jgi:hypothetical protein
MDMGHWYFPEEFDVSEWFGFVYRIIDLTTQQEYIGKKQFHRAVTKQPLKGRKNKRRSTTESKWREYTSSSTHVNDAIVTKGKCNFKFLIESLHLSRGSLAYAETLAQITEDVLRAKLADNVTPKYYNKQIPGIKFIPPAEHVNEARMKTSSMLVSKYQTELYWKSKLSPAAYTLYVAHHNAEGEHYQSMTAQQRARFIVENFGMAEEKTVSTAAVNTSN